MAKKLLVWLDDRVCEDETLVGEKATNLATLEKLAFPLLNGFIITKEAYKAFVDTYQLRKKWQHITGSIQDEKEQKKAIEKAWATSTFSQQFIQEVFSAYEKLCGKLHHQKLLVTPSDFLPATQVTGEANLLLTIKQIWQTFLQKSPAQDGAIIVRVLPLLQKKGIYNKETTSEVPEKYISLLRDLAGKAKKEWYFDQTLSWIISKDALYITDIQEFTPHVEKHNIPPVHQYLATKIYTVIETHTDTPSLALRPVDGAILLENTKQVQEIARIFSPRPVIWALAEDIDVAMLQLQIVKDLRRTLQQKNLWPIISHAFTLDKLQEIKKMIADFGLYRSPSFKIWLEITTPAQVILLENFIREGIDGVVVNTDKLAAGMLGEKDSPSSTKAQDPSLLWAYEHVSKIAHKHTIHLSFFGSASVYPHLLKKLIALGITSICTDPDAIDITREHIAQFEKERMEHV